MNEKILQLQDELQAKSYGYEIRNLPETEAQDYIFWNAWALADELHEAISEMSWKPWAKSRFLNRKEFLGELIDLAHFFNNIWLAVSKLPPKEAAELFEQLYEAKHDVNANRMAMGYDGVTGKCPHCARDVETTSKTAVADDGSTLHYCVCGFVLT